MPKYAVDKLIQTIQRIFYKHKNLINLGSISILKRIFKEYICYL